VPLGALVDAHRPGVADAAPTLGDVTDVHLSTRQLPVGGRHYKLVIDERVSLSDSLTAIPTPSPSGSGRSRVEWEIACASLGAFLGGQFGKGTLVVGAVVAYIWAQCSYSFGGD
jgi:hypothetical protein